MKKDETVEVVQCYLCKRENGCHSAVAVNGKPAAKSLELKLIGLKKEDTTYRFLLCDECLILQSALAALEKEHG